MAEESSKKGGQAVAGRPAIGPEDRTIIRPSEEGEESTPAKPQLSPPYAIVVDGPRMGARFPLSDGPNIIGRAPGNAIRLDDQSVSRQHAEITGGGGGWSVKDLGSKNGTSVNGKPISETVSIAHKDVIKTGIYQLRLITVPTRLEEEMTLPPEIAQADRTVFVAAPPDGLTAEVERREISEKMEPSSEEAEEMPEPGFAPEDEAAPPPPAKDRRRLVMLGALALSVIVFAAWFASRTLFKPSKAPKPEAAPLSVPASPSTEAAAPELTPPAPGGEGLPPLPGEAPAGAAGQPGPALSPGEVSEPAASGVQKMPLFLDIASSPLPARVTFEGRDLGSTPLRVNVELEPGRSYPIQALFVMPEIGQQYVQALEFTVQKDQPVVPILFRGPIGMIKVMDLPRDVQFYLEGKFSYDRYQEQSAKLSEIVLQKPIYIPYGTYKLELRRSRQLGTTSPTYVADIIYHRDFVVAEDSPTFQIEVKEEDLSTFPVKIKTDPPNADVFIDGRMVGKSPYDGIFPLGEHKLTVRKEGYFEHAEDLKVDINTPFIADIKLKTSLAGARINNARLAMNRSMYQEAINELAEALNNQPAPSEVALINYLLGTCYMSLNDIQRAMGYFELAKNSEEQRYPAMLGLANGYAMMQRVDQALPLLVEVMLKSQDDAVKRGAHDLFQKMSPFRSVIYVYSDPPGANVTVNDKPVAQQTPVILHELPLGGYKIRIEKAGYLPTDLNLSLSVNEFNPVIVKLKPIPQ